MAQVLFGPATIPLETDLDANFTELYTRTQLLNGASSAVGIGAAPSAWASMIGVQATSDIAVATQNSAHLVSNAYFATSVWKYISAAGASRMMSSQGQTVWFSAATGTAGATLTWNTTMVLDASGNLLLGTTAIGTLNVNCFAVQTASGFSITGHATGTTTGTAYAYFDYAGSPIGSITQSGTTGVAYNTSSDYRLKDNVQAITGSGAFVDALRPVTWTWKSDGSAGAGFIAHELQAVSPSSVTGAKDAVDADGKPIYQGVEYGSAEVIAMLVAEVKALRARVHALDGH